MLFLLDCALEGGVQYTIIIIRSPQQEMEFMVGSSVNKIYLRHHWSSQKPKTETCTQTVSYRSLSTSTSTRAWRGFL